MLPLVSAAAALCVVRVHAETRLDEPRRRKARAALVRTLAAVTWPTVLLRGVVPRCDRAEPMLALPLAWNALAWLLDAHLLHRAPSADETRPASLRLDPAPLAGLAFGLCSLLGAQRKARHTRVFLYAVVGCALVVLPSHNLAPGCLEEQYFESVQKAALLWCIGALVAGVVLVGVQV